MEQKFLGKNKFLEKNYLKKNIKKTQALMEILGKFLVNMFWGKKLFDVIFFLREISSS